MLSNGATMAVSLGRTVRLRRAGSTDLLLKTDVTVRPRKTGAMDRRRRLADTARRRGILMVLQWVKPILTDPL